MSEVFKFVEESNRIEGILRPPTPGELEATSNFLRLDEVTVADLEMLVSAYQPGAKLRTRVGMDVRIGNHLPPRGGPDIKPALQKILDAVQEEANPYATHLAYETLHPFMDGNGRSGRALWAWQMIDQRIWPELQLGFLHAFYYQALSHGRS